MHSLKFMDDNILKGLPNDTSTIFQYWTPLLMPNLTIVLEKTVCSLTSITSSIEI